MKDVPTYYGDAPSPPLEAKGTLFMKPAPKPWALLILFGLVLTLSVGCHHCRRSCSAPTCCPSGCSTMGQSMGYVGTPTYATTPTVVPSTAVPAGTTFGQPQVMPAPNGVPAIGVPGS